MDHNLNPTKIKIFPDVQCLPVLGHTNYLIIMASIYPHNFTNYEKSNFCVRPVVLCQLF